MQNIKQIISDNKPEVRPPLTVVIILQNCPIIIRYLFVLVFNFDGLFFFLLFFFVGCTTTRQFMTVRPAFPTKPFEYELCTYILKRSNQH